VQTIMTERERIVRTLRGEPCDKIPWATRLDIWYTSVRRSGTLPAEFADMDLMEIHRHLGIARQCYIWVTRMLLHGVEVSVEFNGDVIRKEHHPLMTFPIPGSYVPAEEPGDTKVIFKTPAGTSYLRYRKTETTIREAEAPYLIDHILKDDDDFQVVKWILDHAEQVASFDGFNHVEEQTADYGFTVPILGRIPFQQIMLEYMGEERAIYTMMDNSMQIDYLLSALGEHARRSLELGLELPSVMVEFVDNFEGTITSPTLFQKYCLPFLQASADRAHSMGRVLGSHMDGNMKPLVHLIPECGIDVVESFSPAPLTALAFEEAWNEWRGKVLMWGAIPSTLFEPYVPEKDFEGWLETMFDTLAGDQRIILGIGDQALGPTLTGRIKRVSELLGRNPNSGSSGVP